MSRVVRRHRRYSGYDVPWILREVAGAPVWAMLIFTAVMVGVGILCIVTS